MLKPNQPVSTKPDVLSQLSNFIGRYLQCTDHQRTVLALWVLHTYTFPAAQFTPYLSIQSAYKQSGKTLCLQLLGLLCDNPALTSGFSASNIASRMKRQPLCTLLLDECQATLGTRSRPKAPVLRALLAGGFHRSPCAADGLGCPPPFCPKAFAGKGQLPEDLADRSIPIILGPWGASSVLGFAPDGMEPPPHLNQKVERFHLPQAMQEAQPLKQLLSAWAKKHLPHLQKLLPYNQDQFPPSLSSRRQDVCQPLLHIADAAGGDWPARIRQGLASLFQEEADFHLQPGLQLLRDLHNCFSFHGHPLRLSTCVLLEWMRTLPPRPWDQDGPLNAHRLARMLAAFDVRPRLQRSAQNLSSPAVEPFSPARGYLLADFLEPWRRHLGLALPNAIPGLPHQKPRRAGLVFGVPDQPQPHTAGQKSQIANSDAVCNALPHAPVGVDLVKAKLNGSGATS